jgi:hypothetical protein
VMDMLPLRQGGVDGDDGRWFPSSGSSRSALLEVEEGFCLRCCLRKLWGKIGCPFSVETKAYIRRQRRGDARGANGPWWCGLPGRPRHPCLFGPRGSPCVIPPLQMVLVVNIDALKNPD